MNSLLKLSAAGFIAAVAFAAPSFAALKAGAKAPDFSAPAYLAGEPFTFKLADALKKGPVVVYFFPAAHTPGCNLEAHLFSEAAGEFKKQGATLIGITAGNTSELAAFLEGNRTLRRQVPGRRRHGAKIAKQYDAILAQKPEWSDRTSYVISQQGTIVHAYSELKPNQHVKETLDAVKALKK